MYGFSLSSDSLEVVGSLIYKPQGFQVVAQIKFCFFSNSIGQFLSLRGHMVVSVKRRFFNFFLLNLFFIYWLDILEKDLSVFGLNYYT